MDSSCVMVFPYSSIILGRLESSSRFTFTLQVSSALSLTYEIERKNYQVGNDYIIAIAHYVPPT